MPRLFWGIDLPESIKSELNYIHRKISGAKWVREGQHHITLLFLGDVHAGKIEAAQELAEDLKAGPFEVRISGMGLFGPERSPKVLKLGVAAEDTLHDIQEHLVRTARKAGFSIEKRKFSPHVTLARFKQVNTRQLGEYLEANALLSFEAFTVNSITLFESHLSEEGATYEVVETFELG